MSAPETAAQPAPAAATAEASPASTGTVMTGYNIEIKPLYRGAVRANSNSRGYQRTTFTLLDKATNRTIASSIFSGQGANHPMVLESNGSPVWNFVGRPETRIMNVVIEHSSSPTGNFLPSKLANPVTIKKEPDDGGNEEYYVSVLLSEEWKDNDYDDAVVTIAQWK
ncbi:hypothetical protein ONZ45_g7109 [Pleurotus djamor]|nr:hypothetical protein ONZ45_g7109 [Pleurotus djamor]